MRRPKALFVAASGLAAFLCVGCAGDNRRPNDPFMGANSNPTAAPRLTQATPPTPPPQWGSSNAALTTNTRPSLNPDGRLAIEKPGADRYLPPVRNANWVNDGLTLDQAKEKLRIRRVNWEVVEPKDGQVVYRCTVENAQNPSFARYYVAEAADELSARREVLNQMDKGL